MEALKGTGHPAIIGASNRSSDGCSISQFGIWTNEVGACSSSIRTFSFERLMLLAYQRDKERVNFDSDTLYLVEVSLLTIFLECV